jgi:hypothetical protein
MEFLLFVIIVEIIGLNYELYSARDETAKIVGLLERIHLGLRTKH